jgi:23S rRNA pseudouridine1911/1915/1917 synthase
MLMAPDEYPSFSRARKVCRKGNVLVKRGSSDDDGDDETTKSFDRQSTIVGRVGDRVYPGDIIGKQVRMGNGQYPIMSYKQPFELPVVYEDDYFAIVNKPAGVVVYAHRQGGHGMMTIRACLPFALTPPKVGTFSVLRRPQPCHRLDKPTAGLLLVAKTKPAMQNLCKQFADRVIKKTYTAIVNGIPFESKDGALTSPEASAMGVDVDPTDPDAMWQLINFSLEEKESVTLWRSKQFGKSLKAQDGSLTVVELKPKTGRYHQLRRHMAWVCETPIIGDNDYDGGGDAMSLRERGLFLCSNRVTLEHPYYNTEHGRAIWDAMSEKERLADGGEMIFVNEADNDTIMVTASIELPSKFESFLAWEQQRVEKFEDTS